MRRLRVLALALPLSVVAAPLAAACSACCPMAEESQTLDTAMPCCSEDCGSFLVAGSTGPALKSASSLEPMKVIRLEPTIVDHDVVPGGSAGHPALPAASPPVPARLPLALRL